MSEERRRESVFVRSRWGTGNYYYNWRNPVGRVLIVVSVVFAVAALVHLGTSSG